MKFLVTGELGFIGRNLLRVGESRNHTPIRLCDPSTKNGLAARLPTQQSLPFFEREPCVYRNSANTWARTLEKFEIDFVVHNAAVVGTDVVALNPQEATSTNVTGTYNIVKACEMAEVPVIYTGTTVVYDTPKYQDTLIDEDSDVKPITYYGQLKHTGDLIVRESKVDATIARPLFAYGGEGDMNSLIAKTIYASFQGREELDMFLDPTKCKDYMHVDDFCTAIMMIAEQGLWNQDFIVAAETPMVTGDIVAELEKHLDRHPAKITRPSEIIRWHFETDYLGNHRLSSKNFRSVSGWTPEVSLMKGIERSIADIYFSLETASDYNPLKYLDLAKEQGVDLTNFY